MILSAIVAISRRDRAIGRKGQIPWKIPEDMAYFKKTTEGHPVIMGRKTWESLPALFRPLPKRTNIVMSNDDTSPTQGAWHVASFEEALKVAESSPGNDEVFIIGGGQIYTFTLPKIERLYVTVVDQEVEGADAFFPEYEGMFDVVKNEVHPGFAFQILERKK